MNRWTDRIPNEKGVALPLALFVLVILSGLLLAFLSMAGMEPQVSRNLSDTTQARYLADAGTEWAFDTLVATPDVTTLLATNNGVMATNMPLPGLTAASGTFSVSIRNDTQPGDSQITGLPPDPGGPTTDTNNAVIVTATGTYNGVSRQIQVAMSGPWDLPAALFVTNAAFEGEFKGNTFGITGTDTNVNGTPGSGAAKLGIGFSDPSQVAPTINALSPNPPSQPVDMRGQVQGLGGNPSASPPVASVGQVNPIPGHLTLQALTTLVSQLSASTSQVLTGGIYTGNLMKPDGSPQVTLIDLSAGGEATLTGNGRGILLVKGGATEAELELDQNFRFEGLIIVCCTTAELEVEAEGNAQVFGGVVIFNQDPTKEAEVELEESAQLRRSRQAMAYARQLIPGARGRVWSWREL